MKIKRMAKRLFAVGTGVVMLGATAMGAMAADLSNYPDMMVKDGVYDGFMVVGENAAAVDNLAMTDIAASMKYMGSSSTSSVSVEGDNWQVGTSADWLEVNESIGPSGTPGIVDYIDKTDLSALADGELTNSKGTFKYEQKLHFNQEGPKAWYMENEDDEIGLFWKVTDQDQLAMYELDFVTDAESDIDASQSFALKDFEDKTLTFMGTTWTMTNARYTENSGGTVSITFMAGAASGTLDEGDSQTFTVDGKEYDVALTFVDDDEAAFTVNGENTGKLEDGETFSLADGNEIGVSNILYQNYAGGVHQASFFLGANKLKMTDNISDSSYSGTELKVNEETIDGATVYIKGTVTTEPATSVDGTLKLDFIRVNMTAQDDIYLASGEKLSEDSELVEPQLLFTQNWDFEYHGLGGQETHDVKLSKSGDDKYEIVFDSNDGNTVAMPLMYATGSNIYLGKKAGDNLAMDPATNITDDDYFVLASKQTQTNANSDAVSTVLQYVSSKNSGDDLQTIKFKNLNTGETIERTFDDSCVFDISLNGRTHTFDDTGSGCASDNWDIKLTSSNFAYDTPGGDNVSALYLRDASGALIKVHNVAQATPLYADPASSYTSAGLLVDVQVTDSDKADDLFPVSSAQTEVQYNLSYTSTNEVTAARTSGPTWSVSDPSDTDTTWGMTEYGSVLKHVAASSTPVEFTLTVPETEAKVLAYITSGATSSTVASGGVLTPVEVVDATKLDSEVASVSAQNLIVVGGPCVNSVAAELLGNPANCADGFTPGKARIKLFQNGDKYAMLVAGYSGADTRLAGKVIAHRESELTGMEVEVEGTTYSDATIGAPTVVEEVVAEEPVVEETTTTE